MSTEALRLTEEMARAMLATAPKYKPIYVVRAFRMESDFELIWPGENMLPILGQAGDYITIDDKGTISVVERTALNENFKMIPPRTRKTKGE